MGYRFNAGCCPLRIFYLHLMEPPSKKGVLIIITPSDRDSSLKHWCDNMRRTIWLISVAS